MFICYKKKPEWTFFSACFLLVGGGGSRTVLQTNACMHIKKFSNYHCSLSLSLHCTKYVPGCFWHFSLCLCSQQKKHDKMMCLYWIIKCCLPRCDVWQKWITVSTVYKKDEKWFKQLQFLSVLFFDSVFLWVSICYRSLIYEKVVFSHLKLIIRQLTESQDFRLALDNFNIINPRINPSASITFNTFLFLFSH